MSSVERDLRRARFGESIIKDNDFQIHEIHALRAKQKELKRQGKVNKPKAIAALSDKEIDILCTKKVLGLSSPQALVTVCLVEHATFRFTWMQRAERTVMGRLRS